MSEPTSSAAGGKPDRTDRTVDRAAAPTASGPAPERPRAVTMRVEDLAGASGPAPDSDRRIMPADFSISVATSAAPDALVNQPGRRARRQELVGFEDTFSDIVDFILRCTHRIWEEKAIGYLYEHYSANLQVHHDSGTSYGREPVIAGTTQLISAFPDLRIVVDDIVWCTDGGDGFWTSHRCMLVGRNTGWSQWGPPTGMKIAVRCIADCHVVGNQIIEEFVIYNTASTLAQMGYDVRGVARGERVRRRGAAAAFSANPANTPAATGEPQRLLGQGRPYRPLDRSEAPQEIEPFIRRTWDEIWNWRLLDRIGKSYAPHLQFHGPTDREMYGLGEYTAYVLSVLAMFPDATLDIDNIQYMGNDGDGYEVSVRWHLTGTHTGNGFYGQPTGRPASLWGITHQRVRGERIVEEWSVTNEFDVLVQLAPDSGASGAGGSGAGDPAVAPAALG